MLRKALIALYAIEAIFLLVPWQYFINGRLRLHYNDGIVMWMGVPGFYALARLVMRYGPTLWVRLGGMAWTLVWLVAAVALIDNAPEGLLLLRLASWILALNFLSVVGPLGWALRRRSPLAPVGDQMGPSAFSLGVASWLALFGCILTLVIGHTAFGVSRTSWLVVLSLLPFLLLSPLLATTGVFKSIVELRSKQGRWSAGGLGLSALYLITLGVFLALQLK